MLLKDIIILAGPNGAGKTTAAPVLLPQELGIREFVNADEIARGLSPFNAEGAALAAGRFMIERMRYLVRTSKVSHLKLHARDGRMPVGYENAGPKTGA